MTALLQRVHEECSADTSSAVTTVLSPLSEEEQVVEPVERDPLEVCMIKRRVSPKGSGTTSQNFQSEVEKFAKTGGQTYAKLREIGKRLKLAITQTGRSKGKGDRLNFGFTKKMRRLFTTEVPPRALFKFGVQKDGFFYPSR